jgi:hypothetical protein
MRTPNVRPALLAALSCAPLALAALLAGCGESKSAAPAAPSTPSKDYSAEAKSTIDEKNMDAELEKLKTEVEADK